MARHGTADHALPRGAPLAEDALLAAPRPVLPGGGERPLGGGPGAAPTAPGYLPRWRAGGRRRRDRAR